MGKLPASAIQDELERVLASPAFARSERLSDFLRFVVEAAVAGRSDTLKEYSVGVDVFKRGADFDPRVETTVRTQAHRLRTSLGAYYASEGRNDPIWIEIPKGSYVPVFHERPPVALGQPDGDAYSSGDRASIFNSPAGPAAAAAARRRLFFAVAVLLAVAAAGVWLVIGRLRSAPASPNDMALSLVVPPGLSLDLGVGALSPDGRQLVFPAVDRRGFVRLWLRKLSSSTVQPLEGTDSASFPFWSPDGHFIAFFANGKLKRISTRDGFVETLCDAPAARGGSWSENGVILFAPNTMGSLQVTSADSRTATSATQLSSSRQEMSHRWPSFLPGGTHFLYFCQSRTSGFSGFYVGKLGSNEGKLVIAQDLASSIEFAATGRPDRGYLLFARAASLLAQPFDLRRMQTVGEPQVVALPLTSFSPSFTTAGRNLLLWMRRTATPVQLVWLDRSGRFLGTVGEPADYDELQLSPDEHRLLFDRVDEAYGTTDIWLMDLRSGTETRLTSDAADDYNAIWSPNGREIIYNTDKRGLPVLSRKLLSGGGTEARLTDSKYSQVAWDCSPDGDSVLISEDHPDTQLDLCLLPLAATLGKRRPSPLISGPGKERQGRFCPTGNLVAFVSDESGRDEVYLCQMRPPGCPATRIQVSSGGGGQPRWGGRVRELFFISDQRLMSAWVRPAEFGVQVDRPRPLFALPSGPVRMTYAAAAGGNRFLATRPAPLPTSISVNVQTDWATRLESR